MAENNFNFKTATRYPIGLLNESFSQCSRQVRDSLKQKLDLKSKIEPVVGKVTEAVTNFIFNTPSKKEDYIKLGRLYIAKKLIAIMAVLAVVVPVLFYIYVLPLINNYAIPFLIQKFGTATFIEKSEKLGTYTGRVKVMSETDNQKPIYIGNVKDGLYSGDGELYDGCDHLLYKGAFANGEKNGEGVEYYENKNIKYSGSFKNGLYSGEGIKYNTDKTKEYAGTFASGLYAGSGTLYYPDGKPQYVGLFENGKYSGQGVLYYQSGKKQYEGGFSEGTCSGLGKFYYADGTLEYNGSFESDKYSGAGVLYDVNGNMCYEGNFLKGLYNGIGKLYEDNQLLYEGGFSKGLYEGQGKLYRTPDATLEYEGGFHENKFHDKGILYNAAGKIIYDGPFSNGEVNYGYLLSLTVEDVRKTLGQDAEAYLKDDADWYWMVSQDLKISVCLDLDYLTSEYKASEVVVWSGQSVFGVSPDAGVEEISQTVGVPSYPQVDLLRYTDALGGLKIENVTPVRYTINGYEVTFFFDKQSGRWQFAAVKSPDPQEQPVGK